jgi:hypothetical protein
MRIPITRLYRYNGAIGTLAIGLLGLSPGALALNLGFGDWQAHGFSNLRWEFACDWLVARSITMSMAPAGFPRSTTPN